MSENKPKVSIVIPTYNREHLLPRTVQSCLDQTFRDFEVIIVDDASTDGTEDFVRSIKDSRVKYIKREENGGLVECINKGFAAASGKYLTFTADDDYYAPRAMEVMVRALDTDLGIDFVYTHYSVVDEKGNVLRQARVEDPGALDQDNYIGHCFLYRREIYDTLGGYREGTFLVEDYEYWLRIRSCFVMKRIPESLYYFSLNPGSFTMTHSVDEVQGMVAQIRRPYISAWKHYFLVGKRHYESGRKSEAIRHEFCALALNPLHGPSWRILALAILPVGIVEGIRKVKRLTN